MLEVDEKLTILYSIIIEYATDGNIFGSKGLGRILSHTFSEHVINSGLTLLQYIIDDKHLQT